MTCFQLMHDLFCESFLTRFCVENHDSNKSSISLIKPRPRPLVPPIQRHFCNTLFDTGHSSSLKMDYWLFYSLMPKLFIVVTSCHNYSQNIHMNVNKALNITFEYGKQFVKDKDSTEKHNLMKTNYCNPRSNVNKLTKASGPGTPTSPGSPATPLIPSSPLSPGGPTGPRSPGLPFSPGIPLSPGSPASPTGPASPGAPGTPLTWVKFLPGFPNGPTAPASPTGPGTPIAP